MYLISVYFDTAATKRIQTLIEQIAAASGNHYMTDKKVPPHLTLSAIEARSVTYCFRRYSSSTAGCGREVYGEIVK